MSIAIAVVGSRTFTDYDAVKRVLDSAIADPQNTTIVSGGAIGADQLAERYAAEHAIECIVLRPDWSRGKGAGLQRNGDIVTRADVIYAFWDGISRGTADTIRKAKAAGKPVIVFKP